MKKTNCTKLSSKLILAILTMIFWGTSAGLSYVGANILMTYERYGDLLSYLHSVIPAIILISIAFLLFLIGAIGVCGVFSENKCLLGTFFTFVAVLLALEITGIVLVLVYRDAADVYSKSLFNDILKRYGTYNESRMTQNFDFIQHKLKCCGEFNYTDWQRTWWYSNAPDRASNVPQSCCANFEMNIQNNNQMLNTASKQGKSAMQRYCTGSSPVPNELDNYYQEGCYTLLRKLVLSRFVYISSVVLALAVVQLAALVCTCVLMFCRNKSLQQPPYINIATHEDIQYNL